MTLLEIRDKIEEALPDIFAEFNTKTTGSGYCFPRAEADVSFSLDDKRYLLIVREN